MNRTPISGFDTSNLPTIAYGRGSYLYDTTGKQYVDGSGGPAVFCIGHGNKDVNAAITAQLERVAHGYRYLFGSEALSQLTEKVTRLTAGHFPNLVFVSSGSEAVESCLKIAKQYHMAKGQRLKSRFIARQRSYHGNTIGALSVSGFAQRRDPFEGILPDVSFVSAANAYRPPEGVAVAGLADHLAQELDAEIEKIGPERVAAFIFEPVVGAAGGVVPAPQGYAQKIAQVCRKHDVLMISDEVMSGAGRCGTWRALEHDGVVPDIMSVAKGLAGGYLPLGAALYTDEVAQTILGTYSEIQTGHTFTAHTAACAAGNAVQKILEDEKLVERAKIVGDRFQSDLRQALAKFDEVGDVRGRGFFIGVEFVADRIAKTPFPRDRNLHTDIGGRALGEGLICYPCSGHLEPNLGDTVILAPPYNATDDELAEIIDKFARAIESALTSKT